jgi:hypothetical protein
MTAPGRWLPDEAFVSHVQPFVSCRYCWALVSVHHEQDHLDWHEQFNGFRDITDEVAALDVDPEFLQSLHDNDGDERCIEEAEDNR